MAQIFRTATEASAGIKNHGVRYVLGGSLAFVIVAFGLILAFR